MMEIGTEICPECWAKKNKRVYINNWITNENIVSRCPEYGWQVISEHDDDVEDNSSDGDVSQPKIAIRQCPVCDAGLFKLISVGDINRVMKCGGCDALLEYINETGEIRFHVEDQQD